jgi:hypothetical protein
MRVRFHLKARTSSSGTIPSLISKAKYLQLARLPPRLTVVNRRDAKLLNSVIPLRIVLQVFLLVVDAKSGCPDQKIM